ncbi:NAD(P)-dependent oxidoreductase [Streptomyces sp. NPDC005438]|uniref:NAD-dependent epimerase/dehydratase family protein n=1 Tax=Streptomyces sp. NPDC005438 TaxID=3156880 RepID=UPI0033B7EAB6
MRAVTPADREPPTAVVLGAAGFVGRNICDMLSTRGWSVLAVARGGAPDLPPGCHLERLDLLRSPTGDLSALLARERPALVVNAAGALWDVTDQELTEGNVTLVRRLVEAMASLPRPARLVHIGSAYEYGGHPADVPLTEDLTERPTSGYARTKLAGTRVLTEAVAEGRLDAVVLRIAMSVGPHTSPHSLLGGLAAQLARRPAELRLPPIRGVRDIVDIRDVAEAVRCAARAERVPPVVNIGSGVGVPLVDAVEALLRISGTDATVHRADDADPSKPAGTRRDAGIGEQPLDISRARSELGWAPRHSLDDALSALWETVPRPVGAPTTAFDPSAFDPPAPTTTSTLAADGERIHG